ncbi:MAG: hypothetical protein H6Q99_321 [Proteobacteria bacterium]|nr:hypothetical protein [Pseudomonadota bacterium]
MVAQITPLVIVNRALSRIGAAAIPDMAAKLPSGQIIQDVYDSVTEDILAKNRWTFTNKFAELGRASAAPAAGFNYAFVLPSDRNALPDAYYAAKDDFPNRPMKSFAHDEGFVCADPPRLWAEYRFLATPDYWPGDVREMMVLALAAELALAIREDEKLRALLRRDVYGDEMAQGAGGQFGVCVMMDDQAKASKQLGMSDSPVAGWHNAGGLDAGEWGF